MQTVPSMFVVSDAQQLASGSFFTRRGIGAFQGEQILAGWLHFTPYADE